MTPAEINAEVFRRLEELSTDPAFWTVAEVAEALDEGWDDLALRTYWHRNVVQLPLQDEITYYDLRDFPEEVIRIAEVWNNTTSRWMTKTTVSVIEANNYVKWETVQAQPDQWFIRGAFTFGVFGKPTVADVSAASDFIHLHLYTIPPPLSHYAPDYAIDFPEEFQETLIDFAISDLKSQEGEVDLSLLYWRRYAEGAQKMKDWVCGHSDGAIQRILRG